ncbi:MAG TPA: hypothetical protein VF765_33465 [Polyangiaceae bacterium]
MKAVLAGLAVLLLAPGAVACAQVAGVQEVTFISEQDASAPPPDAHDAAPGADGADAVGSSLPPENCPSCGGVSCCSPKHCAAGGSCCADRGELCTTAADCCNGECDVAAQRCTGPCLPMGASPCVTNADCCAGTCNSEGKCLACTAAGGSCKANADCCFGLSCTGSVAGTCMQL